MAQGYENGVKRMSAYDNRTDSQAGLSDEEFACLLYRSCGVNLNGVFRNPSHKVTCGFCNGTKEVAR